MKSLPYISKCVARLAVVGLAGIASPALACGTVPYVGEVCLNAMNFCPKGYAAADGHLLRIADNTALYSLLGTRFGGDGKTNFALPKLTGSALSVSPSAPPLTACIATLGAYPYRPE
jgi:microcystin-dependent protein